MYLMKSWGREISVRLHIGFDPIVSDISDSSIANRYDLIGGTDDYYDESVDISFVPNRQVYICLFNFCNVMNICIQL